MPTNPPFPSVTIKANFQTGDKPTQAQFEQFIDGVKAIDNNSPLNNFSATTSPTVTSDSNSGYSVGSRWVDTSTDVIYECVDSTVGAAIWQVQGSAGVADGNKGDITVSSGGTVWNLNNNSVVSADIANTAVTFAKVQNVATNTLIGRSTAGTGSVEELTVGSGLTLSGGTLTASTATTTATGVVELATNAEVATGTDTARVSPVSAMQHHQGVCKAWVNFNGTGTVAIRDSYNTTSITDNGTGQYVMNLAINMANSNYCAVACGNVGANNCGYNLAVSTLTTNTVTLTSDVFNATVTDTEFNYVAVFGDI